MYRPLLFLLAALAFIEGALACQICVPRPTSTLADRLLLSDAIVLAREDANRPYHYAAVEVLKGDPDMGAIDLFINTPMRRQLESDPELTMLLARDPKQKNWRAFGAARDDFESVVRRIVSLEDQWIPNETNNLQRIRELAPLLGHTDVRLHELAYLEIGRAPYKAIQSISAAVSLERVRTMLADPRYLEWRGLDILLLGLSDEELDRQRVIREMADRQHGAFTLNLDAWATAYVEVTGTAGIHQLRRWYFDEPARTRDELRKILRALSVHATNDSGLREPVVSAYREMLDVHPHAAPDIARDLIAWQQWGLTKPMRILQPRIAERDPLGAYAVKLYLQRAGAHNRQANQ